MTSPEQLVILTVDQGQNAGWSIIRAGARVPVHYGVARTAAERAHVLGLALMLADGDPRLVYLVTEDHSKMPLLRGTKYDRESRVGARSGRVQRQTATILGMGASRGVWCEQARMRGVPETHLRQVEPRVWKSKILGPGFASADTDTAREKSVERVRLLHRVELTHDGAAAWCMAEHQALALPGELQRERHEAKVKRLGKKHAGVSSGIRPSPAVVRVAAKAVKNGG